MPIVNPGASPAIPGVTTLASVTVYSDVRALGAGQFPVVEVLGGSTAGDGQDGFFYWNSTSVAADDGFATLAPNAGGTGRWIRIYGSIKQPGTGGLTSTVAAALQLLPHSSQYDTPPHFNTVQATLTGTHGFGSVRIGAGGSSELQISLPSGLANTRFTFNVGGGTFSGQFDPTLGWGYNPNRENASEPQFGFNIEGHYYDGAIRWCEHNLDYTSTTGVYKRLFGMRINRATDAADWQWAGSGGFIFADTINGTPQLAFNANNVAIGGSATAGSRLLITGTQNANSTEIGVNFTGTAGANASNNFVGFVTQMSTAAVAVIFARVQNFAVVDCVKGASSTITEQDGFRCTDLTTGATNIAFKGEVSSGANKWNLYMDGTADNFLEGNIKAGTTSIAANNAQAVTRGNVGPGAAGVAVLEWMKVKNAAGTTRYIELYG